MSNTFLCHCNRIAVPAVIEGSTVLVCRHLLKGSQYRTDDQHVPCGYKLEDTEYEYQPTVRAKVLYRRPRPFKPLELPPGSDYLDLYRPKSKVVSNSAAAPAEDEMEVDSLPIEGEGQFVLGEQRPEEMDAPAWQRRCTLLERQLRAAHEEQNRMKLRMVELQEDMEQRIQALEEQNRAKDEEAEYYRKKYEGVRVELHDLRRSTRIFVSNALQPQRTSSPSPI